LYVNFDWGIDISTKDERFLSDCALLRWFQNWKRDALLAIAGWVFNGFVHDYLLLSPRLIPDWSHDLFAMSFLWTWNCEPLGSSCSAERRTEHRVVIHPLDFVACFASTKCIWSWGLHRILSSSDGWLMYYWQFAICRRRSYHSSTSWQYHTA